MPTSSKSFEVKETFLLAPEAAVKSVGYVIEIIEGVSGSLSIDHSIAQSAVLLDVVVHLAIVTSAEVSNTAIADGSVNVPPLMVPQSEVMVTVTVTGGEQ